MTKAKNAKVEMKGKIPNILLGVKRKRSKAARVQELRAMARQRAWVEMLETMHEDEAAVLIAMVDNTINKLFPSVCYDLAAEAFPELF